MLLDPDPSKCSAASYLWDSCFPVSVFCIENKARESFPADALYVKGRLRLNRLLFQVLIGLIT